jgi:hypothetical protein
MKLHYDPETDSLYIELKSGPGAETREIVERHKVRRRTGSPQLTALAGTASTANVYN